MIDVPPVIPVINPEVGFTVATLVLDENQVPPEIEFVNVVVES